MDTTVSVSVSDTVSVKDEKKTETKLKKFIPPTLDEVKSYIAEKQLSVSAEQFFNYFEQGNWIDSKGNKVKNWKQKLLTWNSYRNLPEKMSNKYYDTTDQYNNLDRFYKDL